MSIDLLNNAEGGAAGVTVTPGNSGGASGTAFTAVVVGATSALTFDSASAIKGALSYKIVGASGEKSYLQLGNISSLNFRDRGYFTVPTLPGAAMQLMQVYDASGGTVVAGAAFSGSNKLQLQGATGTATIATTSATSGSMTAGVLTAATVYRIELYGTVGTTTSNGVVTLAVFDGDGTTALQTLTSSSANLGTAPAKFVQFQKGTPAGAFTITWDALAFGDTASPYGPVTATPLTATPGPDTTGLEPYASDGTLAVVGLSVTAAGGSGTGYTYAWSQTAGPAVTLTGGTTPTPTFTVAPVMSDQAYSFTVRVTDSGGATASATQNVGVYGATEAVLAAGVWTPARFVAGW